MKDVIKTGTTTVGIVCKDGIVLAADKRASAGYMVADKRAKKLHKITNNVAVTIAGLVSDAQLLVKVIRAQLKLNEIRKRKSVSVKQAANMLAGLVYGSVRRPTMVQSIVGFLMGGKDNKGFHLYNIGIDGSLAEMRDYVTDGSGMMYATGVLESEYQADLPINDGIKLAVKCINTAIQRDLATGNGITVVTITKDGVKFVIDKELSNKLTV